MGRQEHDGRRKKGNQMLRRITACFNVTAIVLVSIVPLQATATAKSQTKSTDTSHNRKLAPEFQTNAATASSVRVIVQTKSGAAETAQDDAVASVGGTKRQSYK